MPFQCQKCKESGQEVAFAHHWQLLQHIDKQHGPSNTAVFCCTACKGKVFSKAWHLARHQHSAGCNGLAPTRKNMIQLQKLSSDSQALVTKHKNAKQGGGGKHSNGKNNNPHAISKYKRGKDGKATVQSMKHMTTTTTTTTTQANSSGMSVQQTTTTVMIVTSEEVVKCPYNKHVGKTKFTTNIPRDKFGNVKGRKGEFDLCPDNAFSGQQIAILQLYTANPMLVSAKKSMEQKGFKVHLWTALPPVAAFLEVLKKSCQLWIISGSSPVLTTEHLAHVNKFVQLRKGLFLWGDNTPWDAEVNHVLSALPALKGLSMKWNHGQHSKIVHPVVASDVSAKVSTGGSASVGGKPGFCEAHPVFTGLESLYEGITIGHLHGTEKVRELKPLLRGSDGGIVTAAYDNPKNGVRIIIDGGFTRMFESLWNETAGTSRFVTNAACWLYNWEGRVKPKLQAKAAKAAALSKNNRSKATKSRQRHWRSASKSKANKQRHGA